MQLFKNQLRALNIIDSHEKGILKQICGSGKSLIYKTAAKKVKRTIIFVPRKILVEQFYQDYFQGDEDFEVVKINSDQRRLSQQESSFWDQFHDRVPSLGKPMVAIVNYQSMRRLMDKVGAGNETPLIDLIFYDEAHSIKQDGIFMKSFLSDDLISRKNFFFTATPSATMLERPLVFGEILDTYEFSEAVNDGIIKTFTTHIECLNQKENKRSKDPLLWSIGQFILRQGLRRVIIYTNSVKENRKRRISVDSEEPVDVIEEAEDGDEEEEEEIEDVSKSPYQQQTERVRASMALNTFRNEAMKTLPRGIKVDYITAKTSLEQRQQIFKRFRDEQDNTTRVIVSCRTISEGVDLTSTQAVLLLDSRSNVITTTQRILRCTRLTKKERDDKDWKPAIVLIPLADYSVESFHKDTHFRKWLDQFAHGLQCEFQQNEIDETNIDPAQLFPLKLEVGNNVDDIAYDPEERKWDSLRDRTAEYLQGQLGNRFSTADIWNCEKAIFDYTCKAAPLHDPPFARNWDSPLFPQTYKRRARTVAYNLKKQPNKVVVNLYDFASHYTNREMNEDQYILFDIKEREAMKYHPNISADQFMREGWKASQNSKEKAPRSGIACKRGCIRDRKQHPEDEDFGWRVTYTQMQTRSADEPMTCYYTCGDCRAHWKG